MRQFARTATHFRSHKIQFALSLFAGRKRCKCCYAAIVTANKGAKSTGFKVQKMQSAQWQNQDGLKLHWRWLHNCIFCAHPFGNRDLELPWQSCVRGRLQLTAAREKSIHFNCLSAALESLCCAFFVRVRLRTNQRVHFTSSKAFLIFPTNELINWPHFQ